MKLIIYRPLENLNKHKSEKKSRSFIYHAKPQNSSIGGKKKKKRILGVFKNHRLTLCSLTSLAWSVKKQNVKKTKKGEIFHFFLINEQKAKISSTTFTEENVQKKTTV